VRAASSPPTGDDSVPGPTFGPEPLTPALFLDRSAGVFGDRVAVVDGAESLTYRELRGRCMRLAGALRDAGVGPGDRVSVLAPNTHVALEAHFGVAWAGAVLNALNTRLSAAELTWIVNHAGSRVLICDGSLSDTGMAITAGTDHPVELIGCGEPGGDYEQRLAAAEPLHVDVHDEWAMLSLNYTSGTTGHPKGVMYSHRGAYLQALAMVAGGGLDASTRFLWTLPMFHCNGWCYPWAVTAAGGTHVALRQVAPAGVWSALREQGVTHLNAAPTVLTMLAAHPDAAPAPTPVHVATGGAPPSPSLLARLAELNLHVTHLYGLTESYGPAVICDWRPEWDALPLGEQARRKARQGVANITCSPLRVVDAGGRDVPADGATPGEVVLRGNVVMIGYYRDAAATAAATLERPDGNWFRTGDVGVVHPDGYLEVRDRAKDVIISGGENITSIEVEQTLARHPDVLESAVVGAPDETWGEVPVAFVTLRPGSTVGENELIDFVRGAIARFKAPKRVVFGELPKTSTGKIQKYVLREGLRSS
jgi:fatty-acyl-CoA synthase